MLVGQLTILGPGLLGASVAMAAKERGVADRVVVWARRDEVRRAIAGQPWCDEAMEDAGAAVKSAAVVVIATPVDTIVPLVRQIAPRLAPGAVVTDVGSVKTGVARGCQAAIAGTPETGLGEAGYRGPNECAHFVGAHPMAGSEKVGWEHGSAKLFEGRTCFVTPTAETDRAAAAHVAQFWEALGMKVVRVAPEEHDTIVAHISHLPQMLASALCAFLATKDARWRDYAGGGLRDTTRIAASDPALWRTILEANRDEVLKALGGLRAELDGFEEDLMRADWPALAARMARGKTYREGFKL